MLSEKRLIVFLLSISLKTFAQISSATDTLIYFRNSNAIKLDHQFIIESSIKVIGQEGLISPIEVKSIIGEVIFADNLDDQTIVIKYDYLKNRLPLSIGPRWMKLPILDLKYSKKDSIKEVKNLEKNKSNIFSSGSLYRQIQLSQMGGSSFVGGLQMQINGKISDEVSISGILTDQDFPIQPEGSTRELDDLDNVLIKISHSNLNLDAGDIYYKHRNINRKLIGLNNNFKTKEFSGSAVYAKSKGDYKYLELKGRDGDQGPYQLMGNDGNQDIVILAGTEKIWVNGKELIRGTNYDYIIDYSTAEVTFTPQIMINFDSDLAFEYQYSDYQYQKTFMGGNLKKKLGESSIIDIGLYNEDDRYNEHDLDDDYFNSLSSVSSGSITVPTVIIDVNGDYVINNGIYEYDPSKMSSDSIRYQVVFQYDANGEYERRISDQGRIYYAFIPNSDRTKTIQLYSPFRIIHAPKVHQFGYFDYDYKVNEHFKIIGDLSGSIIDQNKMNATSLTRGTSYKFGINIDSLGLGLGRLNLNIHNWKRDSNYKPIGRENEIMHTRLWNLDSSISRGINEISARSDYVIDNLSKSYLEIAQLRYDGENNTRLNLEQRLINKRFGQSFFNYLTVKNSIKTFSRSQANLQINIGSLSPFLAYLNENDPSKGNFSKIGFGFDLDEEDRKVTIGFDLRNDESIINSNEKFQTRDLVGSIKYQKRNNNGINQNIIFKKRMKNGGNHTNDYDYSIFDIDIIKHEFSNPLRWGIKLRKEETLVQNRTVVYDSVGLGMGQYRYDPVFNTYISDPNGSFVSYSVLSGEKIPNTVIRGSQNITLDMEKFINLSNTVIRFNSRQEFQGQNSGFNHIFQPEISDSSISQSNIFNRFEINFNNLRRLMIWLEDSQNFNGLDSRGNNIFYSNEIGFDFNQPLSKTLSIRNQSEIRSINVESTVSALRNRNSYGWWNDLEIQMRLNYSFDLDFGFLLGSENGVQKENNFNGNAIGMNLSSRILLNEKGRFQTEINYVKVVEENNLMYLPPETFNGFPLGISLRTNSRLTYSISRSISIVMSLNTIDDNRYSNFISFQGEVRAYF